MYELNSQDMLKKFTDPSLFLTKWLQEQEKKETLMMQDKNRLKAEKSARRGGKRNKMDANTRATRENSLGFAANYKSVHNNSTSSSGEGEGDPVSDKSNTSNESASVVTPVGLQQTSTSSSPAVTPASPIIVPEDEASEYNRQSIVFQQDTNSSARQSFADNSDHRPDSFSSTGSHHQRIKVSVVSLSTELAATDNNVRVQRAGSSAVNMNKSKSKSKSKESTRRGLFSALGLSSLSSSVVEESEEEVDDEAEEDEDEVENENQHHANTAPSAAAGGGAMSNPGLDDDDYDVEVTMEDPADDSDDGIDVVEESKSESTSSNTVVTSPPAVSVPSESTPTKLDKDDEEVLRVISPETSNSKPSSSQSLSDKTKDEKTKELASKLSFIKMAHNNSNTNDIYSPSVRFAETDAMTTPVRDQRRSLSRSLSLSGAKDTDTGVLDTANGNGSNKSLSLSADTKRRSLSSTLEALASSREAASKDTFNRVEPLAIRLEELNKTTVNPTHTSTTPSSSSDKVATAGSNDLRPKFSAADLMKQIESRATNPRPAVSSPPTQLTPRIVSPESSSNTSRQVTSTSSNVHVMSNKPASTSPATSNNASASGTNNLKSPTTKNVIQNKMFAQILSGQSNLKKVDMQVYLDRKKQQPSLGGFGK